MNSDKSTDNTVQSSASAASSENCRKGANSVAPQDAHPFRLPIGRIFPVDIFRAAYTDPQPSQVATSRVSSPSLPAISSNLREDIEKHIVRTGGVIQQLVTAVATDSGSIDTGVNRDRARADPRVAGLLVVALGLVTIGLIAVGVTHP